MKQHYSFKHMDDLSTQLKRQRSASLLEQMLFYSLIGFNHADH